MVANLLWTVVLFQQQGEAATSWDLVSMWHSMGYPAKTEIGRAHV